MTVGLIHPQVSDNCFSFFNLIWIHSVSILLNIAQDQFFLFPEKNLSEPFHNMLSAFFSLIAEDKRYFASAFASPHLPSLPRRQMAPPSRSMPPSQCLHSSASLIYGRNQANQLPPGLPAQLGSSVSYVRCVPNLFHARSRMDSL